MRNNVYYQGGSASSCCCQSWNGRHLKDFIGKRMQFFKVGILLSLMNTIQIKNFATSWKVFKLHCILFFSTNFLAQGRVVTTFFIVQLFQQVWRLLRFAYLRSYKMSDSFGQQYVRKRLTPLSHQLNLTSCSFVGSGSEAKQVWC